VSAEWTWLLCDGRGGALAELTTARGKSATFTRNSYAEASCVIGAEDDAALLIADTLKTGWPRLRLYRRPANSSTAAVVFNGHFAPMTAQAAEGSTLQIVARSPYARVVGSGSGAGRFRTVPLNPSPNQLTLLVAVVLGGSSNIQLAMGLTADTKVRTISVQPGQNLGEIITNLSNMDTGFDFTERFVDDPAVNLMSYFDTYARLGSDRPEVRFEYGSNTLSNLRDVTITTAPPINQAFLLGANGISTFKTDADSQVTYGPWPLTKTFSSISTQELLDDRAISLLRPEPIQTVDMTPDGHAPRPWDDFYLGDTVYVYVNRGALQINTAARVNSFTVVVDDNGIEAAQTPHPMMPDEQAAISANLEVEVTPS
jgi:hypothetical protein